MGNVRHGRPTDKPTENKIPIKDSAQPTGLLAVSVIQQFLVVAEKKFLIEKSPMCVWHIF
ncbi:unnamed protein product, partial [Musa acuminata subsp. burmannicoides]